MTLDDVERYVGIPYESESFDCADLVALVQKELFGRHVDIPNGRPRGKEGQAALGRLSQAYASKTAVPVDGDLVLMFDFGANRASHAGVFFRLDNEDWVLHASSKITCSILHRVRDLPSFGARIEGFYSWV